MRTLRFALVLLLAAAAIGCGGADASPGNARTVDEMRAAAVRLLFEDANATALPRAYDRSVLRRRMRAYVASEWLDRRIEQTLSSIAKVGGRTYYQSWTEAITVGRWDGERLTGERAKVVYTGYDTICPSAGPSELPMERVTVRIVREHGGWRLATYESRWLTSEGPLGESGAITIRALPERVVFRNPRPRTWKYRGPHIPGLTPCR